MISLYILLLSIHESCMQIDICRQSLKTYIKDL